MSDTHTERDPIELLASEFVERQRRGERPSVEEYARAHPELAAEIRDLFPTIAATEDLKVRREGTEGGRASLGPVKLERLGDFRIVREIGRGGMGIVYEAVQESLNRRVAIKVLPRQFLLNEKGLKRFHREAQLAASLHHTNIAEVFGAGEQDGFHYYVMQYIEGVGLDAIAERLEQAKQKAADPNAPTRKSAGLSGPLSVDAVLSKLPFDGGAGHWRLVARIGVQVASALSYAHAHGTLHRDIKPANLLIDASGNVWITDFGLAKALASESLTLSGEIAGTLLYMSPEQLQGEADARSDLYSLGVTLYELLASRPAFSSTTQAGLLYQVSQGLTTTPRSVNPAIPTDLETIVLKTTATDPLQRYASATDLAEDLQRFLDDLPLRARRASTAERLWRWCRRNKAVASLGAATFVLTLLVAIVASIGLASTRSALKGEAAERKKAEANALAAKANAERAEDNAALAMRALDRIFERFSPSPVGVPSQVTVTDSEGSTYAVPSTPVLSKGAALLLDDMLAFYDLLAKQEPTRADWHRKVADANRRVGDIRRVLGEYAQAEASYQKALAFYLGANGAPATPEAALEASRLHNARGQCFLAGQKPTEARQAHEQALKLLETVETRTAQVLYETARTNLFLGTPFRMDPVSLPGRLRRRDDGDRPGEKGGKGLRPPAPGEELPPPASDPAAREFASKHIETAIAQSEALVKTQPDNPEYRHLLSACYRERCALLMPITPQEARRSLSDATRILQKLVDDFPTAPRYLHDLCCTYAEESVHPGPPGMSLPEGAEVRLSKGMELASKLIEQHPNVPEYAATRAKIAHKYAVVLDQQVKLADGETYAREAVKAQEALARQFPEVAQHRVWLCIFRCELARNLLAQRKPDGAQSLLTENVAQLEKLTKEKPAYESLQFVLEQSRMMLERAQHKGPGPGGPGFGPGPGMGPGREGGPPPGPDEDGKRRPPRPPLGQGREL